MKLSSLLLMLCLSANGFSQSNLKEPKLKDILINTEWRSDYNVFSSEARERYLIYENKKEEPYFMWGNFISFTDSSFQTSYSASCGNDCFTTVDGRYKFVASNKIKVFVKSISRSGFCQEESESPKKSFGIYQINKTPEGYEIVKEH